MNRVWNGFFLSLALTQFGGAVALGADGFHCELKKDAGSAVNPKDIKTRKDCNAKGGKWLKTESDHKHTEGEAGSEHKDEEHKGEEHKDKQ